MIYVLEVLRSDDPEWLGWTRGSLDDVLSDFFYHRDHGSFVEMRIVWIQDATR